MFQDKRADNERQVQNAGQGLFQAAGETLDRETPQLPFSVVSTKPDFSTSGGGRGALFVEFKLVKSRPSLNGTVTEMTSRVLIYRDQGAAVLFVVYDPARAIQDDAAFGASFEHHADVWVTVAR